MNKQSFLSDKLAVAIDEVFKSPFGNRTDGKTIGDLISLGLNTVFAVSGIIILFMLIFAGFKMIQGAGSGNQQDAEKAKTAATGAVIGFVIIFISFWIIRLIELITNTTFITAPTF